MLGNIGFAMDNWKIEQVLNNKFTQVSTNGIITHGAKYSLHILNNGECNVVEDSFTFYTTSNHPEILNIEGKAVLLEAMDTKILSEIKTVFPAMLGHLVWISNGLYNIEEHARFLENANTLDVTLLAVYSDYSNDIGWSAENMFDVLHNSWDLSNAFNALMQGKKDCLIFSE